MSDCCTPAKAKAACPTCNNEGNRVNVRTLQHQLVYPVNRTVPDADYHFCANPDCEVVYFSSNGISYTRGQMREEVGHKGTGDHRLLCYCFGIRYGDLKDEANLNEHHARRFVEQQTRDGACACVERNPAGRCCLKDFPAA